MSDKKVHTMEQFEHRRQLTQILKVIYMCPMDEEIKMIMRLRIWGKNPRFFLPFTVAQVAKMTGLKEWQVEALEKAGVENCQKFLLEVSLQDVINQFNAQENKHKGHMFASLHSQRKRFSV